MLLRRIPCLKYLQIDIGTKNILMDPDHGGGDCHRSGGIQPGAMVLMGKKARGLAKKTSTTIKLDPPSLLSICPEFRVRQRSTYYYV